jgi:hypothetical protein
LVSVLTNFRNAEEIPEILGNFEGILRSCQIPTDYKPGFDFVGILKEATRMGLFLKIFHLKIAAKFFLLLCYFSVVNFLSGAFWCRNMWDVFSAKQNHAAYSLAPSSPRPSSSFGSSSPGTPRPSCPYNDVLVVGAGPAGLATAIELKMMGANVIFFSALGKLRRFF